MEEIRQILLNDWDPIGVKEIPEARDEYDSYIGGVYGLLCSSATAEEIAVYLAGIEARAMGLGRPPQEGLLQIARRLRALDVRL